MRAENDLRGAAISIKTVEIAQFLATRTKAPANIMSGRVNGRAI